MIDPVAIQLGLLAFVGMRFSLFRDCFLLFI